MVDSNNMMHSADLRVETGGVSSEYLFKEFAHSKLSQILITIESDVSTELDSLKHKFALKELVSIFNEYKIELDRLKITIEIDNLNLDELRLYVGEENIGHIKFEWMDIMTPVENIKSYLAIALGYIAQDLEEYRTTVSSVEYYNKFAKENYETDSQRSLNTEN